MLSFANIEKMGQKTSTGVVFDGTALRWVSYEKQGGQTEKTADGRIELDEELRGMLSGSVEITPEAAEKIKGTIGELKGRISIGLESEQVLLSVLSLPNVSGQEMKDIVNLQVDKFSPFPIENMVVSHEVLGIKDPDCLVVAAAVKQEVVNNTARFFEAGGKVPAKFDSCVIAWWHAVYNSGSLSGIGRELVVIARTSKLELVIVDNGLPMLFRAFAIDAAEDESAAADGIFGEIEYTMLSFELEHGTDNLSKITFCGEGPVLKKLEGVMRSRFSCAISNVPGSKIQDIVEIIAQRLAEEKGIDLTPVQVLSERAQQLYKKQLMIISCGILAVWLVIALVFMGGYYITKFRCSQLEKTKKSLTGPAEEVKEMRSKVTTITHYMNRRDSALECLREISLNQPPGVDLTSFTYRKGESVRISGEAQDANMVYSFKDKLDSSKLFLGTVLQGPIKSKDKETFELELKLPEIKE